jgi:hypothetical protein
VDVEEKAMHLAAIAARLMVPEIKCILKAESNEWPDEDHYMNYAWKIFDSARFMVQSMADYEALQQDEPNQADKARGEPASKKENE